MTSPMIELVAIAAFNANLEGKRALFPKDAMLDGISWETTPLQEHWRRTACAAVQSLYDASLDKNAFDPIKRAMWAEQADIEKSDEEGRPWDFRGNDMTGSLWRAGMRKILERT